jgi:hypothetical protein
MSKHTWDVNLETGRANSSPLFAHIAQEVARLVGNARLEEDPRYVAGLILAQLVHVHGLAPSGMNVSDVDCDVCRTLRRMHVEGGTHGVWLDIAGAGWVGWVSGLPEGTSGPKWGGPPLHFSEEKAVSLAKAWSKKEQLTRSKKEFLRYEARELPPMAMVPETDCDQSSDMTSLQRQVASKFKLDDGVEPVGDFAAEEREMARRTSRVLVVFAHGEAMSLVCEPGLPLECLKEIGEVRGGGIDAFNLYGVDYETRQDGVYYGVLHIVDDGPGDWPGSREVTVCLKDVRPTTVGEWASHRRGEWPWPQSSDKT